MLDNSFRFPFPFFSKEKKSDIKLQCYRMEELRMRKDCEGRNPQPGETEVLRDIGVVKITSAVEGSTGIGCLLCLPVQKQHQTVRADRRFR